MYPSASLCREQETVQRDRAASASLQNVRVVAERAASAWCIEAVAAEKREARHERTRELAAQQVGKPGGIIGKHGEDADLDFSEDENIRP